LGIAIVPEMSVHEEIQRGEQVRIPVDGLQYERTLYLARRRTDTHSHASREFAEMVFSLRGKAAD
jgi:DNA-binding transcriptional LysR family regulator